MEGTPRAGTAIKSSSLNRIKGKSSVSKNIFESPGSYAFAQAVDLIQANLARQHEVYQDAPSSLVHQNVALPPEHGTEATNLEHQREILLLDRHDGAPHGNRHEVSLFAHRAEKSPLASIRFRVNPNLSFPASDIEDIVLLHTDNGHLVEMTMNLMGLHGAGSPLPAYFTEHVAVHQDEPDAVRDFFDIFNHHLVTILYQAWRKYRYYLRYQQGATDTYSQRFFSFLGMGFDSLREAKDLNWSRLLAYMGLIAFKGDATGSLESTLRHYFNHENLSIIPCIKRRVKIPQDQLSRLGQHNSALGASFLVGEEVLDQTGKFRISIADLTWDRFNGFLPDKPIFAELTSLIKTILRSRLLFDVELKLRPEEIRPLQIGETTVNRLGWSTWLGDTGDGIVLLEQASTEM